MRVENEDGLPFPHLFKEDAPTDVCCAHVDILRSRGYNCDVAHPPYDDGKKYFCCWCGRLLNDELDTE